MTKLPHLLLLLAAALALPASADQGGVSITLTPPPAKVPLASDFTFKVVFAMPEGFSVRPDTSTASSQDFEAVSFTRTSEKKDGGVKRDSFDVKSRAFTLGVSTYPAIAWLLSGRGVPPGTTVYTSTFTVEVMPLFKMKPGEDIRDIYRPFRYFPWAWLLLALAAALALGAWLYLRSKRAGDGAADAWTDPRSPYQRARDRLDALGRTSLAAAGRIKEYYTGLTSILRFYLSEEFGIDAVQMTTSDLARELKSTGADIKTSLKAREFLQKADLVKFARLKPEDAQQDSVALAEMLMEFNRAAEKARALEAEKTAEAEHRKEGSV